MNEHVNAYWELSVYKKARILSKNAFEFSKEFPKEETYSLKDQIRRSARSIGANIAEAWAKRRYKLHFISKLTDANAEQMETHHWVDTAYAECGYLTQLQAQELCQKSEEIGRMLSGMQAKANLFCGDYRFTIQEEPEVYDEIESAEK